jgi:hypothetical protein
VSGISDNTLIGLVVILCGVGVLSTARAGVEDEMDVREYFGAQWAHRHPNAPRWVVWMFARRFSRIERRAYRSYGYAVGVVGIVAGALTLFRVW